MKPKPTHNSRGEPIPSFILSGRVAYVPMIPKPSKVKVERVDGRRK